jgi:macrolide transport system ATP-binding/permease protein
MRRLRVLWRRFAGMLLKNRLERDLEDELAFHLQMETAELIRRGTPPDEARSSARRRFGGIARTKETYRETGGLPMIETFWQDVRFALRMLRRNPGFSLLAILCLTLGIGANATVFSWIEGILLRPFPLVAHQERMMAVAGTNRGVPGHDDVSWPDYRDFAKNCKLFDAFIVDRITGITLSVGDRAERAPASIVSSNYFDALGVHPILGRGFAPAEDIGRNAHPVTVIGYRVWRERYRADPAIVGKNQMLNGLPHTIIGVAPENFHGTFVGWAMQYWLPLSMQELFDPGGYKLEDRGARWIEGFVRLKPGVSPEQAQSEISAVAKRLEDAYPATNRGRGIRLYPLWETPFNNAGTLLPTLKISLAVAIAVLLIACANVSNLLLLRSLQRRHEMTVRLAIGSARRRLFAQLLTEGLILAAFAAAGGCALAYTCRNLLVLLLPPRGGVSMYLPGGLDWRVLLLSAGVCAVSTLLFALVPAIQASDIDLAGAMRAESSGVVGGSRRALVRSVLVQVQVALSFVLLVGAGLLTRSLQAVEATSPGFSTANVLATTIDFAAAGYSRDRIRNFQALLIERLQSLAGVQSAAFTGLAPFTVRSYPSATIAVEGYEAPADQQITVDYVGVGASYFAAMGIPVVEGREFARSDTDTAPPVAIVNELMASQYWKGLDPVGRRFQANGRWLQVVGIAKMSKYRNLTEIPRPFYYAPLLQTGGGSGLQVRTALPPEALTKALRSEIQEIDPNLFLGEVITMRDQVGRTTAVRRTALGMLFVFGGLALLLAGIGLYGVLSYTVSQRTREFGLRMALGADTADLLRGVIRHGLTLTAAGIVLGIAVALVLTKLVADILYHVGPRDPLTFGVAGLVMAIASLAACLVPAWRASRTDPVRALRS